MNLISQLTQRITPLILTHSSQMAATEPTSEEALLEQFYALVALRLTESAVQQRLLEGYDVAKQTGLGSPLTETAASAKRGFLAKRSVPNKESLSQNGKAITNANATEADLTAELLFAQLWPVANERQTIVNELAQGYYLTAPQTEDLVHTALPLLYAELQHLSRQQRLSLTALLTPQIPTIRAYIAPWAAPFLTMESTPSTPATQPAFANTPVAPDYADEAPIGALQASPADEHDDARLQKSRKRDNKPLLVLVTLCLGLLILAGLAWLAFNYYQQSKVVEPPVVTTPVAPAVTAPPVSAAAIPAKLTLKMDVGQSLYECQATVGNAQLEEALFNALIAGVGEQARQCVITIDANTATEMTSLPSLAGILSVVLPVSFATVELQDNTLSLSAPDPNALNQMIMQIQSMAPALTIKVLEPIVPTDNTTEDMNGSDPNATGSMPPNLDPNAMNNSADMGYNNPTMPSNNNMGYAPNEGGVNNGGQPNYNPSMPPNNYNAPIDNGNNNSGPISEMELDELTNMTIVAEPAQGGRPVQ